MIRKIPIYLKRNNSISYLKRINLHKKILVHPTKSIIKKTLFILLKDRLKNSICLDAFTGTGVLGINTLLNESFKTFFIDINPLLIRTLKNNLNLILIPSTKFIILKSNFFNFITSTSQTFDIIFLDPPYKLISLIPNILILSLLKLNSNGIIYLETTFPFSFPLSLSKLINISKFGINGKVIFYILNPLINS